MKISEIIASLQETLDEHGDVEAILSSDEEGNSYRSARVGDLEKAYKDSYEWNTIHPDDLESGEYGDEEDVAAMGLVGVVVFW